MVCTSPPTGVQEADGSLAPIRDAMDLTNHDESIQVVADATSQTDLSEWNVGGGTLCPPAKTAPQCLWAEYAVAWCHWCPDDR